MLQAQDEILLMEAFSSGEDWAFSKIYEQLCRQLLYVTERITGSKEVAEDIVADAFVKVMKSRDNFTALNALKAYLFKIARNAALDWLRAEKRHNISHKELMYLSEHFEEEVDKIIIRSQILEHLYLEIERLPVQSREIITRSFLKGESLKEIANKMDLAYKTIQNIKTNALRQLRLKVLSDDFFVFLFGTLLLNYDFL